MLIKLINERFNLQRSRYRSRYSANRKEVEYLEQWLNDKEESVVGCSTKNGKSRLGTPTISFGTGYLWYIILGTE